MENFNEIIQEYIDTGKYGDEAEKLIQNNLEARRYYEEMLAMKSTLRSLYVDADVVDRVLARSSRRKYSLKIALSLAFSFLIVSVIIFRSVNPYLSQNVNMKSLQTTEDESAQTRVGVMVSRPEVVVEVKESGVQEVVAIIDKHGEIISEEQTEAGKVIVVSSTYGEMNKALSEISEVENRELPLLEYEADAQAEFSIHIDIED